MHIVTKTLDPKGEVLTTSTTETRTTLEGLSDTTVKLLINTSVEVAGKRFEKPQSRKPSCRAFTENPSSSPCP